MLLTLANDRVSVRLSRDVWNLEQSHIPLAQAVSAVARELGAVPDRAAVQEVQVAIAAKRDAIDVDFWRAVLGYTPMADDNAVAAGGRIVDESHAPAHWTLADRAGNRVCICAWPDGSSVDR